MRKEWCDNDLRSVSSAIVPQPSYGQCERYVSIHHRVTSDILAKFLGMRLTGGLLVMRMSSNPLGDFHPMQCIYWIETHCKIDTDDGLLPEAEEAEIWRCYTSGATEISEQLASHL